MLLKPECNGKNYFQSRAMFNFGDWHHCRSVRDGICRARAWGVILLGGVFVSGEILCLSTYFIHYFQETLRWRTVFCCQEHIVYMGKARKLKLSRRGPKVSLDKQIEDDHFAKPSSRVKVRVRKDEDEEVFMTLFLCSVKADCTTLNE
jgi:hypothetical protein